MMTMMMMMMMMLKCVRTERRCCYGNCIATSAHFLSHHLVLGCHWAILDTLSGRSCPYNLVLLINILSQMEF